MSTLLRFKCPQCGIVQDVEGNGPCWKCHVMISLPEDGVIQIHRMIHTNMSMEIFINGISLGLLGRRARNFRSEDTVRIPVLYGHYNVLVKYLDYPARKYKGIGLEFDVTPQNRFVYLKAARIIPGFTPTVVLEPVTPEEMRPL